MVIEEFIIKKKQDIIPVFFYKQNDERWQLKFLNEYKIEKIKKT